MKRTLTILSDHTGQIGNELHRQRERQLKSIGRTFTETLSFLSHSAMPKECWRLMDFTDEEFESAQNAGVSKTKLCKQAGNSIVVSVLAGIFNNLLGEQK